MQRSQTQYQVAAGNANHGSIRKQALQGPQCSQIILIAKCWDQHQLVGDVEIGVAGRKALAVDFN